MKFGVLFVQLTSVLIFYSSNSFASDFQSPRTAALGGAGHAAPLLTDSIYLNPSYTSFNPARSFSFNYLKYQGGHVTTPSGISDFYGHNMNLSLLDGTQDSLFQAGVGFTRRDDANFIHIGASKSIIKRIGVGLGAKFIFPHDDSGEKFNEGSLSVSGIALAWFQAAIIVDNLFESAKSRGFYREYILGTKLNIEQILFIYIDPHWIPSLPEGDKKWGIEAGAEFPFMTDFFVRIGGFNNATIPFEAQRGNGFAFGAGWLGPKISLDYSYSRALTPIEAYAHNFGLTLFF